MTRSYTTYRPALEWESMGEQARQQVWDMLAAQAVADRAPGPWRRLESRHTHTDCTGRTFLLARLTLQADR